MKCLWNLCFFAVALALTACSSQPKSMTDRDGVQKIMRKGVPEMKDCFVSGLKENFEMQGKVAIQFEVNDQAQVLKCEIKESQLKSPSVEKCMCNRVSTWKFPPAPAGKTVVVNYPYVFQAKE